MKTPGILRIVGAALLLSALVTAQATVIRSQTAPLQGDWGRPMAIIGDVNNDGHDDYAVGAPYADIGGQTNSGRVYLYSGASGAVLWTHDGLNGNQELWGWAVAAAGDTNGDGVPDVLVGAPYSDSNGNDSGRVEVLSGDDGSNLVTLTGDNSGDLFGYSVCSVGSVNVGGTPEFAVGIPFADPSHTNSGQVRIYDASGNFTWWIFNGPAQFGAEFGFSVAGGLDANGDGHPDLVAGYPGTGGARVYNLQNAALLKDYGGVAGFGTSCAMVGDLNGDGVSEIAIGDPNSSSGGRVHVVNPVPAGYVALLVAQGPAGSEFGRTCARLGDWNGGGTPDFAVATGNSSNLVRVYSGEDLLGSPTSLTLGAAPFGDGLGGGGDVDGDGRPDLMVGSHASVPERLWILGAPLHPGSGEDLILELSLDGAPFATTGLSPVAPGQVAQFRMSSPNGGFSTAIPVIFLQPFATGVPLPPIPGFPEAQINPLAPFPLFELIDGTMGPFGPGQVANGVTTPGLVIPSGLAGTSLMIQGIGVSASANNTIFAATDGTQLVL